MSLMKVYVYPHPVLKVPTEPVTDFGPETQKLFDDMIETMYVEDGVGIAAPQVGVSKKVFIACPTMKQGEEYVVCNPELYEMSSVVESGMEGCLSFPGVSGSVDRSKQLRMRYLDREGKAQDIEARDFFARVIQHENDHLNGILLADRVDFATKQQILAAFHVSE